MVKVFAILLGNGVDKALYWNMRDTGDSGSVVRLFKATADPEEFKSNQVNRAFRMLSTTLNGSRAVPHKLQSKPGLWEFHFVGESDVSLVWSGNEDLSGYLQSVDQVRDIEGNVIDITDRTRLQNGPLYLFWRSKAVIEPQLRKDAGQ